MINKSMNHKQENSDKNKKASDIKPNETGGVFISSHVKIYDPNTKEILVQKRGDI